MKKHSIYTAYNDKLHPHFRLLKIRYWTHENSPVSYTHAEKLRILGKSIKRSTDYKSRNRYESGMFLYRIRFAVYISEDISQIQTETGIFESGKVCGKLAFRTIQIRNNSRVNIVSEKCVCHLRSLANWLVIINKEYTRLRVLNYNTNV